MPAPYIEEFLYRGRCPDAEKGAAGTFHVVLAQFGADPTGKPTLMRTSSLSPVQALAAGYPLDKILGEVAAAAVLDRDAALAAKAEAEDKIADAEAAKAAAEAERDVANRDAKTAAKIASEALDAKVDAEAALAAAEADKAAAQALLAEPEGPKNPALHWITGGLLGN